MALLRYTCRKKLFFVYFASIIILLVFLNICIFINSNSQLDGNSPSKRYVFIRVPNTKKPKPPKKIRPFYYSREQIELTKTFKINPEMCNNQTTGITIFIITEAKNVLNRKILRNTWVKRAREKGICVYFLIGLDQSVQNKIKRESIKNQDLIQANIIEDHSNLTLKSISMLRWAKVQCQQDQFILKVEDNVIVDVEALLEDKNKFEKGIYGDINEKPIKKLIRPKRNKLYVPKKYFGEQKGVRRLRYTMGGVYVVTVNVIETLVDGIDSFTGYVIIVENLFITGILAQKLDISREMFGPFKSKIECKKRCPLLSQAVVWPCSPKQLRIRWAEFTNKNNSCSEPNKKELDQV